MERDKIILVNSLNEKLSESVENINTRILSASELVKAELNLSKYTTEKTTTSNGALKRNEKDSRFEKRPNLSLKRADQSRKMSAKNYFQGKQIQISNCRLMKYALTKSKKVLCV